MLKQKQKTKFFQNKAAQTGLCLTFILTLCIAEGLFIFKPAQAAAPTYQAQRVEQSYPGIINLKPGKGFTFWVKFKNTGTATWYNAGANLVALDVASPYGRKSPFQHPWWRDWFCPTGMNTSIVRPGEIGLFTFAIQAPQQEGRYVENYQIAAKNINWISGGTLEIIIRVEDPEKPRTIVHETVTSKTTSADISNNVLEDEEAEKIEPIEKTKNAQTAETSRFNPTLYPTKPLENFSTANLVANEPEIRIGLYSTEDPVEIKANGAYQILDSNGKLLINQTDGETTQVVFDFNIQRYIINIRARRIMTTDSYLIFVPQENNILEIITNRERDQWKTYTRFRGQLELRYVPEDSQKFWVINQLPMEDYLKGMAETGNANPAAYLESMAIAERTYALYHYLDPSRHQIRHFTLTAHPGDQYYRGYDRELMSPNVVTAVEATRGLVATYNNQIAITPYFARSNGLTKLWSKVWGGTDKPWIQPKYVPYDDGEEQFGHGVGMSAWGAWDMAKNRGYNFEEILKYFYTDIEIQKTW